MVTTEQINELRNSFFQDIETKGEDAVHPKDFERLKKDDNWLKRFLLHHDLNHKEALNMLWETVTWRKDFKTNEINDLVKMDIITQGGFFPHGKDKDGCSIFVFKCKKYVKGTNNFEDMKRCVVYWFERLERQDKGKPITIFFDMEGCGLANLDMEFTKYLIGLFKHYYPYFLNYIIIFEMPWVLSAAFKIIKSWLPEKAVQKIKQLSKKDIKEYVALEEALTCWGGQSDYVFNFVPEGEEEIFSASNNKKVHFADGTSMSETSSNSGGDKDHDGGTLAVQPSDTLAFHKEKGELTSTVELHNTDKAVTLAYKLKTTSPEKFRVRPSVGLLKPGGKAVINVTLLTGFQLNGLSRDKFLIMSTELNNNAINDSVQQEELQQLFKETAGRKIYQHRLKCAQLNEILNQRNGTAFLVGNENVGLNQLNVNLNKLIDCQMELHRSVRLTQQLQIGIMVLVVLFGIIMTFVIKSNVTELHNAYCAKENLQ